MTQSRERYNIGAIHNLIRDAFLSDELERFCKDHPDFRPVLRDFGQGFSFNKKVDTLIEYSETRVLIPELLSEIKKHNPKQYERYESQIFGAQTPAAHADEPPSSRGDLDEAIDCVETRSMPPDVSPDLAQKKPRSVSARSVLPSIIVALPTKIRNRLDRGQPADADQPGISTFIVRGLGYALTSAYALLSGYFLSPGTPVFEDLLLLLILWLASFPFFVSYAVCFHFQDPKHIQSEKPFAKTQREAFGWSLILSILLAAFVEARYEIMTGSPPSLYFVVFALLYAGMFLLYGLFLFAKFKDNDKPSVPHQLVWPVTLSIGVALYFGRFLADFKLNVSPGVDFQSYSLFLNSPFFPVVLAMVLLLVSLILSQRWFLILCASLVIGVTLVWAFQLVESDYVRQLPFFITVSAYLAVFESWRITSHVAQRRNAADSQSDPSWTATDIGSPWLYYLSTFAALIISGLMLLLLYMFTDYKTLFLVFFATQWLLAFGFWYWAGGGKGTTRLRWRYWAPAKLAFGFMFLFVLVVDSLVPVTLESGLLPGLVSFSGLSFLLAIVIPSLGFLLSKKDIQEALFNIPTEIRAERPNERHKDLIRGIVLPALIPAASVLVCFFILIIQDLQVPPSIVLKGDRAFCTYALYTVLSLLFIWGNYLRRHRQFQGTMSSTMSSLTGTLLTIRLPSSLLVSVAVFLPAIRAGSSSTEAFFLSLPFFLAVAGGFALNDYTDAERDRIDKPERAIPSGRLSRKSVGRLAAILLLAAGLSIVLGPAGWMGKALQMTAILGVICYERIVRRFGWSKAFYTALLCILPLCFDLVVFRFSPVYLTLPLALYSFIVARELLMDILDLKGDGHAGLKTLPMLLGEKRTFTVGSVLQIFACVALVPIVLFEPKWYNVLAVAVASVAVGILAWLWARSSPSRRRLIIGLLWIPMGLGFTFLL